MPQIVWTEEAEEQLTAIPSDKAVKELLALAARLACFPERGRRIPELENHFAHEIVREIILPRKARVFYLFVPDSNEIIILGLATAWRGVSYARPWAHVLRLARNVWGATTHLSKERVLTNGQQAHLFLTLCVVH